MAESTEELHRRMQAIEITERENTNKLELKIDNLDGCITSLSSDISDLSKNVAVMTESIRGMNKQHSELIDELFKKCGIIYDRLISLELKTALSENNTGHHLREWAAFALAAGAVLIACVPWILDHIKFH